MKGIDLGGKIEKQNHFDDIKQNPYLQFIVVRVIWLGMRWIDGEICCWLFCHFWFAF